MKGLNLLNQKFGRLRVLERQLSDKHGKAQWLCKCECGSEIIVASGSLQCGNTKSCGCLHKEQLIKGNITRAKHGMSYSKEYSIWIDMHRRCKNKNHSAYKNYGGRGIRVCERWFEFENFYSDMGECPKALTIERIDNNKGYSPDNCKWATRKEQGNNSRKNTVIEYKGLKLTIKQWAEKIGINYWTLQKRILFGWPIEKALTTEIRQWHKRR